jgi:hypothetical protein
VECGELGRGREKLLSSAEIRRAKLVSAKIPIVARLPWLVVAVLLGAATVFAAAVRFSDGLPISPWEPAIAMEGMRLNAGLPLYETGHAAHMYGPLLTVFLAGIFRVAGLNLLAGRIAFSVFSFALAALLSAVLCRGSARKYWFIAFLLFLGVNFRTNLILFSAQADCAAAFFAVAALCLWIARADSRLRALLAIALFVCAMLFKQTSAAFALIPAVHALIWKRRFSDVVTSLIPTISIFVALAAIYLIWPQVFFGMVTIPASIKVYYNRVLPIAAYFIATFPIFFVALFATFFSRERIDDRERWIWSGTVVLVPVSIWTTCKSGGGYSSLLFGYLAMLSLFVFKLDSIWEWIVSRHGWRSVLAASGVALIIVFSFFIQFNRDLVLLSTRCGDEKYEVAVGSGRRMPGRVISPQDPTIAYRASGYFGRSLFFELDAHAVNGDWPIELPDSLQRELAAAKYVVQVSSYVPTPMFQRQLEKDHFYPMDVVALRGSAYTIWARGPE